jgi:ketosteroid isomerase-like protein
VTEAISLVSALIRALRAQSNQAIAAHDADRTVSFMAPDVVVGVAGGPTLKGRDASRAAFAEQFADRAFVTYERTIEQVTLPDPMRATECGRWVGRWRLKTGLHEQEGSYVAEWRFSEMGWLIYSETFVEA